MTGASPSSAPEAAAPSAWARRNRVLLSAFGPVLVLAGVLGFATPARLALMSGAAPYNVFHIASGIVAMVIVRRGDPRAIALFNFVFGMIDIWQAIAGVAGLFPAAWFALRPADHVVHALLGPLLAAIGWRGLRGGARAR